MAIKSHRSLAVGAGAGVTASGSAVIKTY